MGIRIHRSLAGIALAVAAVSVQAQGTIKIGFVNEATGPNAEAGVYTVNSARRALEEVNAAGGILGRKSRAGVIGSHMTNPPDAESIREGILGMEGWKGVEETYSFDDQRDGPRGYGVVKNETDHVTFIKHIDIKD